MKANNKKKISTVIFFSSLFFVVTSNATIRPRYYGNSIRTAQNHGSLAGSGFERDWVSLVTKLSPSSSHFRKIDTQSSILGQPNVDYYIGKESGAAVIRGDYLRSHQSGNSIRVSQNFEWVEGDFKMTSVHFEWPNQFGLPLPKDESVRMTLTGLDPAGRSLDLFLFLNPQPRSRLTLPPHLGNLLYFDMLPVLKPVRSGQQTFFAILVLLSKTTRGELITSHAGVFWHQFDDLRIELIGDPVPASQHHFLLFRNNPPPLLR